MNDIDTANDFGVGVRGEHIVLLMPPMPPGAGIERDKALRLAAWIVALVDYDGHRFEEIKRAIADT